MTKIPGTNRTSHQRALKSKCCTNKIPSKQRKKPLPGELDVAFSRTAGLPSTYDSEDEEHSWGPGGLVPNPSTKEDVEEDSGANTAQWKKILDGIYRMAKSADP